MNGDLFFLQLSRGEPPLSRRACFTQVGDVSGETQIHEGARLVSGHSRIMLGWGVKK
jgi:hypothetical protein